MALIVCPECAGAVSDKACSCPHCGYPMKGGAATPKPRGRMKHRANGSGTVVKMSDKRRSPFQVRVNTRINEFGFPEYDVLGNYPDRVAADIALAEYNKDPYDLGKRGMTFQEVFCDWYRWKYQRAVDSKEKKTSSQNCMVAAFNNCHALHGSVFSRITAIELQGLLDDKGYSHAKLEHIKTLLNQMYRYALQFDIAARNCAEIIRIRQEDDTEHGVPFSSGEIALLWENKDKPFVDTILIYIYSGWRINELAKMPLDQIDLKGRCYTGGSKNRYSKDRTIPIHSRIYDMVAARYDPSFKSLIYHDGSKDISQAKYREHFNAALRSCGIQARHTPHDCRHTCNTLMDNAGVNRIARYKIMGHAGKDINEKVYSHKDLEELRKELEKI